MTPPLLPLASARRARVWLCDAPPLRPLDGQCLTRSFPAPLESAGAPYSVAVEMMVPRGPRSLYGLLGLSFTPADAGEFQLSIPDTAGDPLRLDDTLQPLGLRSDRYAPGLPLEFAEYVFQAADALGAVGQLAPGSAVVRWAVHGEASSSGPAFRHLASIALRLTMMRPNTPTAPHVLAMFDEPLP